MLGCSRRSISGKKGDCDSVRCRDRTWDLSVPEESLHIDEQYKDCKYGNIADCWSMVGSVAANRFTPKDSVGTLELSCHVNVYYSIILMYPTTRYGS